MALSNAIAHSGGKYLNKWAAGLMICRPSRSSVPPLEIQAYLPPSTIEFLCPGYAPRQRVLQESSYFLLFESVLTAFSPVTPSRAAKMPRYSFLSA